MFLKLISQRKLGIDIEIQTEIQLHSKLWNDSPWNPDWDFPRIFLFHHIKLKYHTMRKKELFFPIYLNFSSTFSS